MLLTDSSTQDIIIGSNAGAAVEIPTECHCYLCIHPNLLFKFFHSALKELDTYLNLKQTNVVAHGMVEQVCVSNAKVVAWILFHLEECYLQNIVSLEEVVEDERVEGEKVLTAGVLVDKLPQDHHFL